MPIERSGSPPRAFSSLPPVASNLPLARPTGEAHEVVVTLANGHQVQIIPRDQAPAHTSVPHALGQQIGQAQGEAFVHQLPAALRANGSRPAYGIQNLGPFKGPDVPVYGKTFTQADVGKMFGDKYIIVGAKPQGVEPGFTAKKVWTHTDTEKMLGVHGDHKYMQEALVALLGSLSDSELLDLAKQSGNGETLHPTQLREELQSQHNVERLKGILTPMLERLREDVAASRANQVPLKFDHDKHIAAMREHIKASVGRQKFEKLHYMKLDYSIRASPFSTKYARPARKNVGFWKGVVDFFVRWWKSDTPRGLNKAAVRECLANDLTRAFGVNTQKLKLVESRYATGETKWMLDGTHVTGTDPSHTYMDLEPCMSGHGDQQVLVKTDNENGKPVRLFKQVEVPGQGSTTVYTADNAIQGLGEKKILFMLMGDVDAVGARGQNKGRIGDEFVAIDPGHSLSTSSMDKRTIRNDFSMTNAGSYRNFSIFDQSPYSERMQGVKKIQALRQPGSEWGSIFDQYKTQFGAGKDEHSNFQADIASWQSSFESRADYIVNDVFKDRLAVYECVMGVTDPEARGQAHAQVLDMVDALEKITSQHTWTQRWTDKQGKRYQVDLQCPLVKPQDRQEWRVTEDKQTAELVFKAIHPKKDFFERWQNFKNSAKEFPVASVSAPSKAEFEVRIAKKDVAIAAQVFNLNRLRDLDKSVVAG